jgi:hypothetical protein
MKAIFQIILIFLALTGATTLLMKQGVVFGTVDYWQVHGALFLIFIAMFPRLTLLFSSVPFGGLFWWLGWIFAPRFLVAVLATIGYWNTNKPLVVIAWIIALGGETTEKYVIKRRVKYYRDDKYTYIDVTPKKRKG